MPRVRLSVKKIREVLRLKWECASSHREIAASCGIAVGTVSDYVARATAAGLSWPLPDGFTEAELHERLFPQPPVSDAALRPLPDWKVVEKELRRKGVTLLLLWQEYRAAHPDGVSYSRFCQLRQAALPDPEVRMAQEHTAGEKLFVDYAGQTMAVIDPKTGVVRTAQIFVASLGVSSYTFAEATWSQAEADWISSHVRAFSFYEGTPRIVVPDNLKVGITSPHRYDPEINRTYQELANHYHIAVIPARVRKPRDKAKAESAVQVVERWILAPLRDRKFFSLAELCEAIEELLEALNDRPRTTADGTRRELFVELDLPALRALPLEPFELCTWKGARVHIDYHVAFEKHNYSVPYRYSGQPVQIRATAQTVEIYHREERIASHLRSVEPFGYTTVFQHMPTGHQEQQGSSEWNASRLIAWGRQIGPSTETLIQKLLARHVIEQQSYRGCLGILRLAKEHGKGRLDAACARALRAGNPSYQTVQRYLKHQDEEAAPPLPTATEPILHDNIRGSAYYEKDPRTTQC